MRYILSDKETGQRKAEFPEDMLAEIAATRVVSVGQQLEDWKEVFRVETAPDNLVGSGH